MKHKKKIHQAQQKYVDVRRAKHNNTLPLTITTTLTQ